MAIAFRKILVVRNDKLGDFTLALPAFALLKRAIPDCQIFALVPEYTKSIASLCPAIDSVLIDHGPAQSDGLVRALRSELRTHNFDAVITLFSTTRIGLAIWAAKIPYRLAPATKLAQFFYNHRLKQHRSKSIKPEYEYNLDLIRYFLESQKISFRDGLNLPVLSIDTGIVTARRQELSAKLEIDPDIKWLFVHPGHGGSANNLSVDQYASLINQTGLTHNTAVIVTAGPGEESTAHDLLIKINCPVKTIFYSSGGLIYFTEALATADLFVSGSTGPLHLAGALNRCTVAFYPRRKSSSALRWQTLNEESRRLAFMPPDSADERDMEAIDIDHAARLIRDKFAHIEFAGKNSDANI